ncbi:hypothetical protein AX15_000760 [Amanita polypyramis BW_CC]|nr:hypothetical protein AX15_000760 [Amanita polypyramis BW_CC]
MKTHAKDKEQYMFRCPFKNCFFKSLQKSNVENHTSKHGRGRIYICKHQITGCQFCAGCPKTVKKHLSAVHDSSQPTTDYPTSLCASESTPTRVKPAECEEYLASPPVSTLGLAFSNGHKPSRKHDRIDRWHARSTSGPAVALPQPVPASPHFSYHQAPHEKVESAHGHYMQSEMTDMDGVFAPSYIVVIPGQLSYAIPSGVQVAMNNYTQGQPQMPVLLQQCILLPAASPLPPQDVLSPPFPSPTSSISSLDSLDSDVSVLDELAYPMMPLSNLEIELATFRDPDSLSMSDESSFLLSTNSWDSSTLLGTASPAYSTFVQV